MTHPTPEPKVSEEEAEETAELIRLDLDIPGSEAEDARRRIVSWILPIILARDLARAEGEREGREKERAAIAGWLDGVPGLRGQVARTVNTLTGQIVAGDHRQGGE